MPSSSPSFASPLIAHPPRIERRSLHYDQSGAVANVGPPNLSKKLPSTRASITSTEESASAGSFVTTGQSGLESKSAPRYTVAVRLNGIRKDARMRICLFEDHDVFHLEPLSLTRPAFD